MKFSTLGGGARVWPLTAMQVCILRPGDANFPEPNHVTVDGTKHTIYVREDESETLLDKLRRLSANDASFCEAFA